MKAYPSSSFAPVAAVDLHEPALEGAARQLLNARGLLVAEQHRFVLDVGRVGERDLERLLPTVEDLRLRVRRDAADAQRERAGEQQRPRTQVRIQH